MYAIIIVGKVAYMTEENSKKERSITENRAKEQRQRIDADGLYVKHNATLYNRQH